MSAGGGSAKRGAQGGPTGSIEYSPGRKAAMDARQKGQEKRWAARGGPVTVRSATDPEPPRRTGPVEVPYEPRLRKVSRPAEQPSSGQGIPTGRQAGPDAAYRAALGVTRDQRLPSAAGTGHRTAAEQTAPAPREPATPVTAPRPRTGRATKSTTPKPKTRRGSNTNRRPGAPGETDAAKKRRLAEEKSLRDWETNNPRPPAGRAASS